ncbi:hypothetical protein SUGI_0246300 [Cryptomeria japonica]|uniref:uncharacterized protein LOC131027637 n=1 Tax=Cryptomeria japonica TaxID=3369 RepID=UPI002408D113|nr:uncharacterized protein LOC131027637 [Cryptomeria japonica]GLJ15070.1 hypothetical protein SUGI_0246300 [Cryptomeria japonica]
MEDSQVGIDSKFLNRLLSKESKLGCSSRALYYAAPGAVPFGWESEPGTPKHRLNLGEEKLPAAPLSPPPSLHKVGSRSKPCLPDSSPNWPLKLSGKFSASNLSLKLSGAFQIVKGKMRVLRSQNRVFAQEEERRHIWRRRSKSCEKKSNGGGENRDYSVCRRWMPSSLKKMAFLSVYDK